MPIEEYYTIEEVAEKLKVTRQAIHNWIRDGRIESLKLGRARRIPAAALERFLEQSRDRKEIPETPRNKYSPVLIAA
jgi:excisionase family DNA binding protein